MFLLTKCILLHKKTKSANRSNGLFVDLRNEMEHWLLDKLGTQHTLKMPLETERPAGRNRATNSRFPARQIIGCQK